MSSRDTWTADDDVWELWHAETNNLVGGWDTEAEARAVAASCRTRAGGTPAFWLFNDKRDVNIRIPAAAPAVVP